MTEEKLKPETTEEIVKDIKESGVPEKIAKKLRTVNISTIVLLDGKTICL